MAFVALTSLALEVIGILFGAFLLVYCGQATRRENRIGRILAYVGIILSAILFVWTLFNVFNAPREQQKSPRISRGKWDMEVVPTGVPSMNPGQIQNPIINGHPTEQ